MAAEKPQDILRREWRWWLAGALLAVLLASIQVSGWPQGLLPRLSQPYVYQGDSLSHGWMIQRLLEGSLLENPRSGYPFGSNFADYPNADGASLLLLKAIGMAGADFVQTMNLYFLLGFALVFIAAYGALRAHGLGRPLAMCAALLFDFAPFHFQRVSHLFYTMYLVVPVFYYLAWRLWQAPTGPPTGTFGKLWRAAALLALGSFGVYYAFFGLLVVASAAFAALLRGDGAGVLRRAFVIAALVGAGVMLNLLPNALHAHPDGANPEVAQRQAAESEVYGFKFVQLLMPRLEHHVGSWSAFANRYYKASPLANENATANLGLVAAAGMLALLCATAGALAGRRVAPDVGLLALVLMVLLMFGWTGGFGSLFAQLVSPSLRGWNRISIFIAYGALLGGFLMLQAAFARRRRQRLLPAVALLLALGGMFDQTSHPSRQRIAAAARAFADDRAFARAIEAQLPAGSAVHQLPYMGFPEVVPRARLQAYDHMAGVLHSRALRWSYAGMKGREGDLFYRALEKESMREQLDVLRRLGFAGICVDRRGYPDGGTHVLAQLQALLGAGPLLAHSGGERLFFRLGASGPALAPGQHPMALMRRAGFYAGPTGKLVYATLAEGADFTRDALPVFLKSVGGLSYVEPDGRWSDASLAPAVVLTFREPLPPRFTLDISGFAFGPNRGQYLTIRIGGRTYRQRLQGDAFAVRQPVSLDGQFKQIELMAPHPVSPFELGAGADLRKVGVKLARVRLL